jgi:uncharacterized membrane protein
MNHLALLLDKHPLVFAHLLTALGALLLGAVILWRRQGTPAHRWLGWAWVALMGGTVLTSAFIRDYHLPNIAGITPIHAFTIFVAWQLPLGVWQIRQGRVQAHRKTMRGLYQGGCLIAGLFTLLPGRFLGTWLWGHTLGWTA